MNVLFVCMWDVRKGTTTVTLGVIIKQILDSYCMQGYNISPVCIVYKVTII